jgi:hypothetical protein
MAVFATSNRFATTAELELTSEIVRFPEGQSGKPVQGTVWRQTTDASGQQITKP